MTKTTEVIVLAEETGARRQIMEQIKMICDRVNESQSPEAWTMQITSTTHRTIRNELCVYPQHGLSEWISANYRIKCTWNHYNGSATICFEPYGKV